LLWCESQPAEIKKERLAGATSAAAVAKDASHAPALDEGRARARAALAPIFRRGVGIP